MNTSDQIINKWYQHGNKVTYDDSFTDTRVLNAGNSAAFDDVDCSAVIPDISQLASITTAINAATLNIRANGSSATAGLQIAAGGALTALASNVALDSSQIFEYKISANTASLYVHDYTLNVRN
jgi:hypothetical protein